MNVSLSYNIQEIKEHSLQITGSKSESNRLLILQALYPTITINNLSRSDDTKVLQKTLLEPTKAVDVHHAGTAMRFLTAYFSALENTEVTLTGSKRMQERPIGILVDALQSLGADITYLEKEGFPPITIKGRHLKKNKVSINANVSSQYISALMLIAPNLKNGLEISLDGKITSLPYINMTVSLLNQAGVRALFTNNKIVIPFTENVKAKTISVISDWSSASYFYSYVSLAESASVTLNTFTIESIQGDSALTDIYKELGVETIYNASEESITLKKCKFSEKKEINLDLSNTPDIAQTIAVTCFGLGVSCYLTGLHTLKVKETDRLVALKNELEKLGGIVTISEDSLKLKASEKINRDIKIDTYNDHRMAMAFAPLAVKVPIIINDMEVVSKSYPKYWEHLEEIGFSIVFQE